MNEDYGTAPLRAGTITRADIVKRYRRNADSFAALIAATPASLWDAPSPCVKWSALGIVVHTVGLSTGILRDHAHVEPTPGPEPQADPASAFAVIADDVEAVLADATKPLELVGFIDAAVSFDLPQHAWDLAKATGQDATLDPEFVQTAWDTLTAMTPEWWGWQRKTIRAYGPEVPVPEDAPLQDRLLGLLGRDPNWTPATAKKHNTATTKKRPK